ncbi:MAG: DUF2786 domain-containing protein [Prevotella sp.]|nr:DUF2786 domain-containing protein [Prevotella sp.]
MNTKEVPEKILERIRKLLRLQEGAEKIGSEGEAYAAAQGVHRLLTEYNLSMSDIKDEDGKVTMNIGESDKINYDSEYGSRWRRWIMTTIAKYNYCELFIVTGSPKMLLIGQVDNVAICKELFDYLVKTFRRLSRERFDIALSLDRALYFEDAKRLWFRSYLEGCAAGLDDNFESHQITSEERGLMVCHKDAIMDWTKQNHKVKEDAKPRREQKRDIDPLAFLTGQADGREVSLNKQLKQ